MTNSRGRRRTRRVLSNLRRPVQALGRTVRPITTMGTPPRLAPSLCERYPGAITAPRTVPKPASVPLAQIIGTVARPSQHDVSFRPIKPRQTRNWEIRAARIERALDRLEPIPPVELFGVGDEYFVVDGHKRVAAAKEADAAEIDAIVTRLWPRGAPPPTT